MAKKKVKKPAKKIVLRTKPKLSLKQKAQLRKIMGTVRLIKIWNQTHA